MKSQEKLEQEIWRRYTEGQKADVISRALRIHVNAVRNIIEERRIVGDPEPSKLEKTRKTV